MAGPPHASSPRAPPTFRPRAFAKRLERAQVTGAVTAGAGMPGDLRAAFGGERVHGEGDAGRGLGAVRPLLQRRDRRRLAATLLGVERAGPQPLATGGAAE